MLENPKILKFFKDEKTFKYQDEDGMWQDAMALDVLNSFDQTDELISTKLFDIKDIFVNDAIGDISKQMECFYLTINIAGVFQGRFKKKFLKTLDTYNFDKWEGVVNSLNVISYLV